MSAPEYDFGLDESTKEEKRKFDDGLAEIDKLPLVRREIGLIQLQKELEYNSKQFDLLINSWPRSTKRSLLKASTELLQYVKERSNAPLIKDLLSQGLTLVAGDGGCWQINAGLPVA